MDKFKLKLKKIKRIEIALVMLITVMILAICAPKTVNAANEQFTLDPMPTPRTEVVYSVATTANVSTADEFIAAYQNTSITRIVLHDSISFSEAQEQTMSGIQLDRSLQVDGGGHAIHYGGTAGVSYFFRLSNVSSDSTFHLKDVNISKSANDTGNILVNGGNENWEVIFDDMSNIGGVRYLALLQNGTNINVFFRNTVRLEKSYTAYFQGIRHAIFEDNCDVAIDRPPDGAAVFYDNIAPNDSVAYFGSGSTVDIEGSNSYPVFFPWKQFDAYPTSNVFLHKTNDVEGVQDSYGVDQIYRIDSDATFRLENASGPALYDYGRTVSFQSNSNATIELIGHYTSGIIYFTNANSKAILNNPANFDIRNTNTTYQVLYAATTTNPALQILNSNIGVWNKNTSQSSHPTDPSPFNNVTLLTGNTTALSGSSAVLNTMPGGWNTSNYARIAYATKPTVSASDITMPINTTRNINPTYEPSNATVTYSSSDTNIATVNSSGVVTGVGVGTTTVRITVTTPNDGSAHIDIDVTVTNDLPVLTVPGFTEISINSPFNPLTGVTATDGEDGNLINDVVVTGSVDTSTAGVYKLSYSVTDSSGNSATANQVVLVNDGSFVVGDNYILQANDFSKRIGQVDTSAAAVKTAAGVKLYEKATGNESALTVNIANDGGYTAAVGTYDISFEVAAEPATTKTITATVTN